VADGVEWWVQGTGLCDKVRLRGVWSGLFGSRSTSRAMHIVGMIAEDDRVAAEIESDIRLVDGRDFRNTFHIAFVIGGGKILKAREYFDTAYVQKMFASTSVTQQ